MKTVTLFNRIPPKSAVYVAAIVSRAGGWVVTYQNARIGATLPAPKDKTPELPYEAAEKVYDKLVAEKMRGGYKPEEGGAAQAAPSVMATAAGLAERESGLLPQLLNEVEGAARRASSSMTAGALKRSSTASASFSATRASVCRSSTGRV